MTLDEFTNILSDAFLYQLVEVPTRKNNILDLVLVGESNLVESVFVEGTNCHLITDVFISIFAALLN